MNDLSKYILPEGNVLLSVSGGRTSGFMLNQILEANGGLPDRAKVCFANTGREMPETLDYVQEMSSRWNVPIIWLEYTRRDNKVSFDVVSHNSASREGEPFEKLIISRSYLPNIVERFCTVELKIRTIKRYLVSIGWKHWVNCVGIRADEKRRVKVSKDVRFSNWYPLHEAKQTKREVKMFWRDQPFDLMTELSNCDGCFQFSEARRAMMFREHPERMKWWPKQEADIGGRFIKSGTYADLRDFVEIQGDWIFDDQDFLCQKDGGECT